jgi:hypothetical protein
VDEDVADDVEIDDMATMWQMIWQMMWLPRGTEWQQCAAYVAATWMMTWPNNYLALHGPFPSHHNPLHDPCHSEIYTALIKFSPYKIHPNRINFYSNSTIST